MLEVDMEGVRAVKHQNKLRFRSEVNEFPQES
jgi:hypothetical protein